MQDKPQRIAHLSTYLIGGASIAAQRIFDGLKEQAPDDFELQLYCRNDQPLNRDHVEHLEFTNWFQKKIYKTLHRKKFKMATTHYYQHLHNRPDEYDTFSAARNYSPTFLSRSFRPTLVHLHWVSFLFDYLTFFRSLPGKVPIVWTLHDMNAFTGGCHYSFGCERFQSGCGNCGQIRNSAADDVSAQSWKHKKQAYEKKQFTIVTPSQWLLDNCRQSPLFPESTRFEWIPYGLDTQSYRPVDRQAARKQLGIPNDARVIMFGADDTSVKRKGMHLLQKVISELHDYPELVCAVFGNGDFSELKRSLPEGKVVSLGYLESAEKQREAYSSADLFLMPSLEDNQPQTGLEAMACGTPVVAFDAGGVGEYVRDGKTGLLAARGNTADMGANVKTLLDQVGFRQKLGGNARRMIESEFEIRNQSRRYLELYQQILHSQSCLSSTPGKRAA